MSHPFLHNYAEYLTTIGALSVAPTASFHLDAWLQDWGLMVRRRDLAFTAGVSLSAPVEWRIAAAPVDGPDALICTRTWAQVCMQFQPVECAYTVSSYVCLAALLLRVSGQGL